MKNLFKYLFPLFLGVLCIPIPILGDFHFESAILVGSIGCFWGAISSCKSILKKDSIIFLKLLRISLLFALPLLLFSIFTNCFTWDGVAFWVLIPAPSILFGISIGRFYRKIIVPLPLIFTISTLLFFGLGILLFEFLTLPQVYFFNHVWGGWPGPIYDETVRVSMSLVYFRVFTFGWILIFWLLPDIKASRKKRYMVFFVALALVLGYQYLPSLGISTPTSFLKKKLPFQKKTSHFNLHFDKEYFSNDEIEYWALKHEFHFQQITSLLDIDWPPEAKIESFLYANAWNKKELVGAKFTSYVPIWLEQDQLHIAKQHLESVLKHELVHVISKRFGNNLFNGSWSIGLIEGLAEGIAKDASKESTLDQILAADPPYPEAQQMKNALSITGFYSSAGSISYTTTGSFVSYLLENYPISCFKKAYASSDFEESYQLPFDSLVFGWQQSLPILEIDSVDQQISNVIFSQRSIFQKTCPHKVSPIMEQWDKIQFHEANNNTELAFPLLENLYALAPENVTIKGKWLNYQLEKGNSGTVTRAFSDRDSSLSLLFLKADGFALWGKWKEAYQTLNGIKEIIPDQQLSSYKYSFEIREDSVNWMMINMARYDELIPPPGIYNLNSSTKTLILQEALNERLYGFIKSYGTILLDMELNPVWFNTYESLIDRLVYQKDFELAQHWIDSVSSLNLRLRYIERLKEQQEWLLFVESHSE